MTGQELQRRVQAALDSVPTLTILDARFPWLPEVYHDENGAGNCLALTEDGFACFKVVRGIDGCWTFRKSWEPSLYRGTLMGEIAQLEPESKTLPHWHVERFTRLLGVSPDEVVGLGLGALTIVALAKSIARRWEVEPHFLTGKAA